MARATSDNEFTTRFTAAKKIGKRQYENEEESRTEMGNDRNISCVKNDIGRRWTTVRFDSFSANIINLFHTLVMFIVLWHGILSVSLDTPFKECSTWVIKTYHMWFKILLMFVYPFVPPLHSSRTISDVLSK